MSLLSRVSKTFCCLIFSSFFLFLLSVLIFLEVAVECFLIPSLRQNAKQELTNSTQVFIGLIHDAGARAKNLLQQVLIFSKQGNIEKRPVDIGRVITEALGLLKGTIPAKVELLQKIEGNPGIVFANKTQIHQIVMNLCTNASHAMEKEDGRLEIDFVPLQITDKDATNYPELHVHHYLKLMVLDTGHGINPELLPRIFGPYFTSKPPDEETNLGLSTAHGIIKDRGGSIPVYSEVDRGTTFRTCRWWTRSQVPRSLRKVPWFGEASPSSMSTTKNT